VKSACCSEYQRYKLLRAIHNSVIAPPIKFLVVQNIKDTNFCEQFTTALKLYRNLFGCSEYQRYKLLRAIHNGVGVLSMPNFVVQNIKDTNFCEQFTTHTNNQRLFMCCSEYQRYKLLRAIHNTIFAIIAT